MPSLKHIDGIAFMRIIINNRCYLILDLKLMPLNNTEHDSLIAIPKL